MRIVLDTKGSFFRSQQLLGLIFHSLRRFITKCDSFTTKYESYYKTRRLLQNASVQISANVSMYISLTVIVKICSIFDPFLFIKEIC